MFMYSPNVFEFDYSSFKLIILDDNNHPIISYGNNSIKTYGASTFGVSGKLQCLLFKVC